MADNTNQVSDEFGKKLNHNLEDMDRQIKEFIDSKPSETKTDTESPEKTEAETDKPKKEENNPPAQDVSGVIDGVSRAYADDMSPKKPAEKSKSKSHDSKPPERGKAPKVADGKDIMEVAWNEFWAFCDSVIDGTVDLAFDFITFVLYPKSTEKNDEVKKEIDVMEIGDKYHNKSIEKIDKTHKFASDICSEIDKNLQNVIAGEKAVWSLVEAEPEFFTRLVEAKKQAIKDPTSPEAEKIKRWENMPQVLESMSKNYKTVTKLANHLAIVEEYLEPATKNKEAEINKAQNDYKDNPEKLKEALNAIEEAYNKPEKKIEESIASRSHKYLEEIVQNLNKIRVIYKDKPEQSREVSGKYVEKISEALKDVRQKVYVNMYEKNEHGKNTTDQAQKSITEMSSIISSFEVEGKPIKDHKPAEKHEVIKIEMDEKYSKLDVFQLIRNKVMTR